MGINISSGSKDDNLDTKDNKEIKVSYRSKECNKKLKDLPYGNHQDRSRPPTFNNVKHNGTCTNFLTRLQEVTQETRCDKDVDKFESFVNCWHEENNRLGGVDENGLRMRVQISSNDNINDDGEYEFENVCEGEVISMDKGKGLVTIQGADGGTYVLLLRFILAFQ